MTDTIASTALGPARGRSADGVAAFLGIPYAASTEGRRFLPPLPAEPWEGTFDATAHGPISPQIGALVEGDLGNSRTVGPMPNLRQGEDCLVLNVYTPGLDDARRPVMVWLHGRGFASGAGSEGWYDGSNLARRGEVVVITINHRLNVFGYLNLVELGGDDFAGSGVAGLLDIVEALRWIRANASAFGGDPDNVTIFGESGGGRKVCALTAMPSAAGLFHRAIVQSSVMLNAAEPARSTEFAELLIEEAGLQPRDIAGLQALPFEELTAAYTRAQRRAGGFQCTPTLDATFLPDHPHVDAPAESSLAVPLLLGTNRDEAALFMARDLRRRKLTRDELEVELEQMLGDRWPTILAAYEAERPDATPWDLWVGISSEARRLAAHRVAELRHAAGAAPTYLYLFAWESDFLGGLYKAAHAMEIPFVFDNTAIVPMTGEREDRGELASVMSQTWARFAAAGDPNHEGLPRWEPFDPVRRPTMVFDVPTHAEDDPAAGERLVWEGDLSQYR
jgi:para-nitrobenzyl esterase